MQLSFSHFTNWETFASGILNIFSVRHICIDYEISCRIYLSFSYFSVTNKETTEYLGILTSILCSSFFFYSLIMNNWQHETYTKCARLLLWDQLTLFCNDLSYFVLNVFHMMLESHDMAGLYYKKKLVIKYNLAKKQFRERWASELNFLQYFDTIYAICEPHLYACYM